MVSQKILFDRNLLRQNAARARNHFYDHNFLYVEVANKIADALQFLNRDFGLALEIGARDGYLAKQIKAQKIITSDISGAWGVDIVADDEFLPFKSNSFDLVVSNLNLHFINQVPQFLLQVKDILKPDGVFIASFFGEENLSQLAHSLYVAENEIYGGVSPRMSPTIDVKTAANLLQKAGFKNPISDFEKIEVDYSNPLNLLKDLKMMGQGNILCERSKKFISKRFLNSLSKNFQQLYGLENGGVKAVFEIVTVIGWKEK